MKRFIRVFIVMVVSIFVLVRTNRTAAAEPSPTCSYKLTGSITSLLRNAPRQTVQALATAECRTKLAGAVQLVNTGVSIPVVVNSPASGPTSIALQQTIPASISGDTVTWDVQNDSGGSVGTLLTTIGGITVSPKLGIRYDSRVIHQSAKSGVDTDSNLGIAVVGVSVENQARLSMPAGWSLNSEGPDFSWKLVHSSWGTSVSFDDCKTENSSSNFEQCDLSTIDRLAFRVSDEQTTPLIATLRLIDKRSVPPVNNGPLEVRVTLAASARGETVPIPFESAIVVRCNDKTKVESAGNGDTIAVSAVEITLNRCDVEFDPLSLSPNILSSIEQFGAQPLLVHVHKDGTDNTKDSEVLWTISTSPPTEFTRHQTFERKFTPLGAPQRRALANKIHLPQPSTDADGTGFYTVTVRHKVPAPTTITYRDGTIDQADQSTLPVFTARLKLRGPFSWSSNVRTFVTVPINATSIRFPASSVDLRNSSSSTTYQVSPFTAGVLFGFEQWDYRVGKNTWAVPIRGLAGMQLINLSNGNFSPSTLLGASATFPVIESPSSLGTSLAAGLFWEVDLREPKPLQRGGHILLTLGVNLFSLGSPTTQNK